MSGRKMGATVSAILSVQAGQADPIFRTEPVPTEPKGAGTRNGMPVRPYTWHARTIGAELAREAAVAALTEAARERARARRDAGLPPEFRRRL